MTAPAGLRHPALRQQDRWLSTSEAERVTGYTRRYLARLLSTGVAHGHRTGKTRADARWLTYGTCLLIRAGADVYVQREKCARCRGELGDPPALRGSARGRHRP